MLFLDLCKVVVYKKSFNKINKASKKLIKIVKDICKL